MTLTGTYPIEGGDYERGGSASRELKETLKRIGADPGTVRRTMIAAYEAEMNVVIHAHRGVMKFAVDPQQVDIAVVDEGPGIPDIERAMQEGYSTAPPAAREQGFGAGMGLPNMRRNSDRFSIQSAVDRGTQVRFTVFLRPQEASAGEPGAVAVLPENCTQCLQCLHACPTLAIRVRERRPQILEHLCAGCTACLAACGPKALTIPCLDALPDPTAETVIVLPGPLLGQFGPGCTVEQVASALAMRGYRAIRFLDEWETALRVQTEQFARGEAKATPVLSPMCPAVVQLIRVRFPSLLPNVAPFLTPIEAAREEITAPHVVFVPMCPAQVAALQQPGVLTRVELVTPQAVYRAVRQHLPPRAAEATGKVPASDPGDVRLAVAGLRHVRTVLDAVENGLAEDYTLLELLACDEGCFGSPLWTEDPFLARPRYARAWAHSRAGETDLRPATGLGSVRRTTLLKPRAGLRLAADMRDAIERLARMDALVGRLPGRNCGTCGAPTCAALAEDVVVGRADTAACIYFEHGGQRGDVR